MTITTAWTARTPQPGDGHRLRWWGQHQGTVADLAAGALVVVGAGVLVVLERPNGLTWVTWSRVVLTLALAAGMLWRRQYPLALTVVAVVGVGLGASELVLPVALATLAVRRAGRVLVGAAVAGGAAYLGARGYYAAPYERTAALLTGLPNAVLLAGLPVAVGAYLRTRGDLLRELRARAQRAEAEDAARLEQARLSERTRIAREMHDVLAHKISLLALHAGALELNSDRQGRAVQESAIQIRTMAREALEELRGVLGVLRSPSLDTESLRPQPKLSDVDLLAAASAQAGIEVHLDNTVSADAEPPLLLGRTAYRLVQESLTNVHRHAPGARADVRIAGTPGGRLQVEVTNRPSTTRRKGQASEGAGLGLVGLRERVELAGGFFGAGPQADGGFVVRADLPWPRAQAAS